LSADTTSLAQPKCHTQVFYKRSKTVNEETFNTSIRKLLKTVGVRSQDEIERAVTSAIAAGKLKGTETFPARMHLTIDKIEVSLILDGEIRLE
jgi:hypothetical protein